MKHEGGERLADCIKVNASEEDATRANELKREKRCGAGVGRVIKRRTERSEKQRSARKSSGAAPWSLLSANGSACGGTLADSGWQANGAILYRTGRADPDRDPIRAHIELCVWGETIRSVAPRTRLDFTNTKCFVKPRHHPSRDFVRSHSSARATHSLISLESSFCPASVASTMPMFSSASAPLSLSLSGSFLLRIYRKREKERENKSCLFFAHCFPRTPDVLLPRYPPTSRLPIVF